VEQIVYDLLVAQRIRWSGHTKNGHLNDGKKNIRVETNEAALYKKRWIRYEGDECEKLKWTGALKYLVIIPIHFSFFYSQGYIFTVQFAVFL